MAIKLSELAQQTGCRLQGNDCLIENVADLDSAVEGQLAFVYSPKYLDRMAASKASAIITKEEWVQDSAHAFLISDNPRLAFVKATRLLNPPEKHASGISPSAVIADGVKVPASAYIGPNVVIETGVELGENAQIGAGSVIAANVRIGDNTVLYPNVTIGHDTQIGKNCILFSGVVIGADGFGYERDGDHYLKIPQLGNVRIGNDVEIGANSTVDRGALHDTVIAEGVKIDNLVQVGHNVQIGRHTVISAQTGVAGSTKLGEYCLIGGAVAIRDNIEITDNVVLTGRTLVMSPIREAGVYSSGILSDRNTSWRKNTMRFRQLDDIARRLARLEKALAEKNPADKKD
ncbi:MAG TPA: UDP-3-O-(3-hydroxymyristoyl)glucosamine N-acyltransferase [Gammaproteobacteria bacterium]|nr:UDP-3-O-(3-hydroxymyristoyl)glucosamine N-acyltransferase [Gammaproteobacteria bacterium]